ncbi:hypothetical protein EDC02_5646 [Micromonospora sp. Llam0]|uniref:hypothetical protein n=1 Tax=Micromonospora sp. Llam0 TaxID=2485143 RepID=UPI000F491E9B|nr:hypothetical protein [Micromonospora sp. Llam0]ROO50790.1 hypothetical protein EDC02_5646 [Micromonospora sp. Llam0]
MTAVTRTGPRDDELVIVAVEGLCYSGKSTLIHHLAPRLDAIVAPEYTELASLPSWPPADNAEVSAALRRFLDIEEQRAREIRARTTSRKHQSGPGHREVIVLLDRSPLTLIAHEYGMQALGVPADPDGAATLYADAASAERILVPAAYLYLSVPDAISDGRRASRGPIAAHLDDPVVRARIDETCRSWLRLIPSRRQMILDGTMTPSLLATAAASFITDLAGPSVPSWRLLVDAGAQA